MAVRPRGTQGGSWSRAAAAQQLAELAQLASPEGAALAAAILFDDLDYDGLTTGTVARMLDLTPTTVRRQARAGKLRAVRQGTRLVYPLAQFVDRRR